MASADVDFISRPFWQDPSEPDPLPTRTSASNAPRGLDDLFDYDDDMDAVPNTTTNAQMNTTSAQTNARRISSDLEDDAGIGIDEEVKIRKRRAPIAKLDEERLLSANGISKLRKITKDRLKFKGKGHEFSDVSRLLNTYQLWLDDLFPKAKFADGLAIIEKLGHKKRLQVMRKVWIDEEKPKPTSQDVSDPDEDFVDRSADTAASRDARVVPNAALSSNESTNAAARQDEQDEDDIYAEPTPPIQPPPPPQVESGMSHDRNVFHGPDEDELDALLAEDNMAETTRAEGRIAPPRVARDEEFADEEEAMADMGMW